MKVLKNTGRTLISALPVIFVSPVALASAPPEMPGPGVFGLIALGVIGALAISRSRK